MADFPPVTKAFLNMPSWLFSHVNDSAVWAVIIAFATFLLVAKQIGIANRQTGLLERQDRLLHRRAFLILWAVLMDRVDKGDGRHTRYQISVLNVGTRSASAATVQLRMPDSFAQSVAWASPFRSWYGTPDLPGFLRLEVDLDRHFFVDVVVKYAQIVAIRHPGDVDSPLPHIEWRLAFEDDVVPEKSAWEPLTTRDNLPDKYR